MTFRRNHSRAIHAALRARRRYRRAAAGPHLPLRAAPPADFGLKHGVGDRFEFPIIAIQNLLEISGPLDSVINEGELLVCVSISGCHESRLNQTGRK